MRPSEGMRESGKRTAPRSVRPVMRESCTLMVSTCAARPPVPDPLAAPAAPCRQRAPRAPRARRRSAAQPQRSKTVARALRRACRQRPCGHRGGGRARSAATGPGAEGAPARPGSPPGTGIPGSRRARGGARRGWCRRRGGCARTARPAPRARTGCSARGNPRPAGCAPPAASPARARARVCSPQPGPLARPRCAGAAAPICLGSKAFSGGPWRRRGAPRRGAGHRRRRQRLRAQAMHQPRNPCRQERPPGLDGPAQAGWFAGSGREALG